jgi:hypothetical protein
MAFGHGRNIEVRSKWILAWILHGDGEHEARVSTQQKLDCSRE